MRQQLFFFLFNEKISFSWEQCKDFDIDENIWTDKKDIKQRERGGDKEDNKTTNERI